MFELLLQADKSMSDGLLDQAERTYWQLIELDPTNGIAVAGLARISLQRGDTRLARTFADRALSIDPDSIAARRVIQALDDQNPDAAGPSPSDLPLRGAERLEALSRRRTSQLENDDGGDAGSTGGRGKPRRKEGTAPPASASAPARDSGRAGGTAARSKPGTSAGMGGRVGTSRGPADAGGRGRTRQFESLPAEPLREPRRTGRLAAAAAAAAAAAHEPAHARHEPHHAMPSGRRLFEPGQPKTRMSDPFAEAEMAAAVAAVDAMDDTDEVVDAGPLEADASVAHHAEPDVEAAKEGELERALAAADATEPDESVSLRIALLADPDEVSASIAEADSPGEAPAGASFDAAEESATTADAGQAGEELSERDAEMEALREAVAMVMGTDQWSATPVGEPSTGPTEGGATTAPAETAGVVADEQPASPAATEAPAATAQPEAETSVEASPEASTQAPPGAPTTPRKKGLFRRFRGS